jgi:hypothetical protein
MHSSKVSPSLPHLHAFLVRIKTYLSDANGKLDGVAGLGAEELADFFDKLSAQTQLMQKFLTDSTFFLPAYDIRTCQEVRNERCKLNLFSGNLT